jgi:hypothetical protein
LCAIDNRFANPEVQSVLQSGKAQEGGKVAFPFQAGFPFWPPGFIPPPFDWFQFAMLYIVGIEVVLLSRPRKWQREIIQILFWTR